MPRYLPQEIANEFIERYSGPGVPNQMWLQKMVHLANGWNLAINNEPLVNDPPEAWDNGPVFRRLWNHLRDWGYGPQRLLVHPPTGEKYQAHLTDSEREIVDHVWRRYGQYSGIELSRMTHQPDTPWSEAYFQRGRNARLDQDRIRDHYVSLALAGRGKSNG